MRLKAIAAAALLLAACSTQSPVGYWDDYDFSSQKGLQPIEKAQQRFGDWLTLLEKTDTATAAACIRDFLDAAKADTVSYYVYSDFFMSALYPLESPYHNVELLRVYLRKAIDDGIALDYLRFDEEALLRKSYLNLKGSTAEDGGLLLADGCEASVLGLAGEADRTLLMLVGQAGCKNCLEGMRETEARTPRKTRLVAVVEKNPRGEADWLRRQLDGSRWNVVVAQESFRNGYDYGLAPISYLIDRKGKIKSIIK
jgi:hypothetical protein